MGSPGFDIALVHGSYHGGWCWDLLRPNLEALGHRVITMDLPISEPGLGAAAYAAVVEEALDSSLSPVIVGHSAAGLVIPLVAARRPVKRLVFLAAFMPLPGKSAAEQRSSEPIDNPTPPATAEWTDFGNNVWGVGPNTARELFFRDVSDETAQWAFSHLRPQCYDFMNEVTPLSQWPDVPSSSIVCSRDTAINPDWVRNAAHDRLGIESVEIAGAHSPFMSRPAELARIIDSCARSIDG